MGFWNCWWGMAGGKSLESSVKGIWGGGGGALRLSRRFRRMGIVLSMVGRLDRGRGRRKLGVGLVF